MRIKLNEINNTVYANREEYNDVINRELSISLKKDGQ